MNTQKLAGKTALVTGASKGIGASIAQHLAAEGASVVVNYASSKAGADKVVAEIAKAGGTAIAVQGDVAKPADIYEFGALAAITPEHFHRQFNINVLGLLLTTQEAVKLFPESGGSIINIGSVVTSITPPESAVYTGTKGAVDAITGVLSKELGARKIRVNALNPGVVETEGTHASGLAGSDMEKAIVAQTPLGRTGQPADIASIAVFLASDDSGWLTGEEIRAGGGLH